MIRYCIHSSSFASFIGKHPYVKHHDAFESVWKRASPATYSDALRRHNRCTDQERLQHLRDTVPEVEATLHAAGVIGSSSCATSSSISQGRETLTDELPVDLLTKEDTKIVHEEIRRQLFTSYGVAKEQSVIEILKKDMDMELAPQEDVLYARTYDTQTGIQWKLVGKIDACTADGKTIVEVKNRVRRLFMKPPEYERIQVECYVQLVDTADKALLVESLRVDGGAPRTLNLIPIDRDDELWYEWKRLADRYINILDRIIHQTDLQDAYMESKRPSSFLKALSKDFE
jgi:hypothetical protein